MYYKVCSCFGKCFWYYLLYIREKGICLATWVTDHLGILFYSESLSLSLLLTNSLHLIAVYLFCFASIYGIPAHCIVHVQNVICKSYTYLINPGLLLTWEGESLINGNVIMIIVIMNTSNLSNCPFPGNPHNNQNFPIILWYILF